MYIKFPRVACIHGTEHVASIFFEDLFKLEDFDTLVTLHNLLRNYFGSAHHDPASMLKKHSKDDYNAISLSFIKIADTRMVGKIIALLRLLRLRDPLVTTINSNEFRKSSVWWKFSSLLLRDEL